MADVVEQVPSIVKCLEDTVKEIPQSGLVSCPLCKVDKFKANKSSKIIKHLKLSHWKHHVEWKGILKYFVEC